MNESTTAATCVRCAKPLQRKAQKFCGSSCRKEQKIADNLVRGGLAVIPASKECLDCGVQPASKFGVNAYSSDGLLSKCRGCYKKMIKAWQAENPDPRARARNKNLLRSFGISSDEYEKLLASQGGVCCICKKPPVEGKPRLAVDHDHRTGEIRGLLHANPCNKITVGYHDVESARALLKYLESPPARDHFGSPRIAERSKSTGRKRRLPSAT